MEYKEFEQSKNMLMEKRRHEKMQEGIEKGNQAFNKGLFWALFWRFRLDLYPILKH